jgi:S1-C subfamily serine protease
MGVRCPTGEVQFTPNPANCLRVLIWDEDGSMFKAGLRSGDRITAVDGQTFELQAWLEAIAKKAPERTLSLSVLRDGASLQLAVPNRAFSGEDGGYCQPSFEP